MGPDPAAGGVVPVMLVTVALASLGGVTQPAPAARETSIVAGTAQLYARDIGQGPPMIVLHGGPDFDHSYFLPDLDRLADTYRLIYFDQRGRGRSATNVRPETVSLASDLADLDAVRTHYQLDRPTLLGHSWGTVLALEYALRYPNRVSRLILMNPAPASAADFTAMRTFYLAKIGTAMDQQRAIATSAAYKAGDPEAVAARYRIHFKPAFNRIEPYEQLMTAMKAAFIRQGRDGIITARAVEDRLMQETWLRPDYNLLPRLAEVQLPTLVIYGDHDFIQPEVAAHIAAALPKAQLVTLKDCGHFSYLECPNDVRRAVTDFFARKP
jgi:proline iminopeptidase